MKQVEQKKFFRVSRKKVRNALTDRRGVTLLELIVTFALISLFVVLSCQVMASAMNLYHKIQGINYGRQVSDTLMDKIVGEIAGAQVSIKQIHGEGPEKSSTSSEYTLVIDDGGAKIDLYDGTGSHIYITSDKYKTSNINQLIIHYYRVETTQEGSEKKVIYEPVNWTFDENVYLGYEIDKLQFSLADPSGEKYLPNVIKIDLTLKHQQNKYSNYSATRYVECYNFQSSDDFDKIHGPGTGNGSSQGPQDSETETFPGTDIVVGNSYWPTEEEIAQLKDGENIDIKAGGIFQYKDGNYYIVNKELNLTKDQASSGPGGDAYNWFYTQKLTGNIVVFEENEQKSNLQRGDLCKVGEEYFVYIDGGTWGYSPAVSSNQWYKIP